LFKPDGAHFFDPSAAAARRSFSLWFMCLPLWLVLKWPVVERVPEGSVLSPLMLLVALTVVAIVSILLQLLVVYRAAERLNCVQSFSLFVSVTNAATVISLFFLLVATTVGQIFLVQGSPEERIFFLMTQAYLVSYTWFIAHTALRVSVLIAAIITGLQICSAYFVIYLFALLLNGNVPEALV
jgi:hypothetical protein